MAAHRKPRAKCVCLNCGKEFETQQCYLKRGGGRFCSIKCVGEFMKDKPKTEAHCKNISKGLTGKPKSTAHIRKISESKKGPTISQKRRETIRRNQIKMFYCRKQPKGRSRNV